MTRLISRSVAIAVVLIGCVALAASAQDARLASRLDARTVTAVTRVVDSARARSLPTEPLVQKALQGAAKRAPSERVVAAVRELLGELAIARSALGQRSTEAELVAGAGALHAGIPAATLTRIRAVRGTQSVTVAVGTLADLVARGVPVEGAVNAILTLAGRGAADADFLAFSNQVGRDIAAGAPPAVAARVRSVGAGASGARPATVPGRPDNAAPRAGGRRPAGQVPAGRHYSPPFTAANLRTLHVMLCVALCGCPSLAVAQTAIYFEAGGARVRYSDTVRVSAGTLSAAASALTPNTSFSALLAGSTTQQSRWTMFGAAQGSVFTPARGMLRGEFHGNGSLTTYGAGSGSAQLFGGARLHFAHRNAGAWLGASAGSVKDPVGWRSTNAGEIGAWMQMGPAVAQAVIMPVRIAGGVRYTDAEGTVRFGNSHVELVGVAGVRTTIDGYDESPGPWASVNATAWALRTVGITAGIGSYPTDPGQDLPAAKYVSLGVRITPRNMRRSSTVLSADVLGAPTRETSPAMTVVDGPLGRRMISYRAASARRVEIMGDFTDWNPVEMSSSRSSGVWTISLPVSSGVHQVNVRIDGGEWIVPAGLTTVRDEFGGSVGILLVP